jgi:hypothetical protein
MTRFLLEGTEQPRRCEVVVKKDMCSARQDLHQVEDSLATVKKNKHCTTVVEIQCLSRLPAKTGKKRVGGVGGGYHMYSRYSHSSFLGRLAKKIIFVNTVLPGTNADIPLSDSQVVSKNVEGVHIARLASQRPDLEK